MIPQSASLGNSGEVVFDGYSLSSGTHLAGFWIDATGVNIFNQYGVSEVGVGGVNGQGEIIGSVEAANGTVSPFETTTVNVHLISGPSNSSNPTGISDDGQLIGATGPDQSGNSGQRAVLWTRGIPQILPIQDGAAPQNVIPIAINSNGVVVGRDLLNPASTNVAPQGVPFEWSNGHVTYLPGLGGWESIPTAINSAGTIVGSSVDKRGYQQGVTWTGGTIQKLPLLSGTTYTDPLAINDLGQIVGDSVAANGSSTAFIFQNGKIETLDSLMPSTGYHFVDAQGINDNGEILALAEVGKTPELVLIEPGIAATTAAQVAGVPVAIPEPIAAAVGSASLLVFMGRRKPKPSSCV